jgi:hypothetical protein
MVAAAVQPHADQTAAQHPLHRLFYAQINGERERGHQFGQADQRVNRRTYTCIIYTSGMTPVQSLLVTSTQPPRPPQNIPAFARECLNALAQAGLGRYISLGGAFGLAHYYEYRVTHDVDAWWTAEATRDARVGVIAVLEQTLGSFGQTRTRTWGDVVSVDLRQDGQTIFNFQIATRSALLRDEVIGMWQGDIRLDSFDDLIASKMTALVNRGAPRDFLDIYTLCQASQTDIVTCWRLWQERQRISGEDDDLERAKLAVRANLARIEAARPLAEKPDDADAERSAGVRTWFEREFLYGMD